MYSFSKRVIKSLIKKTVNSFTKIEFFKNQLIRFILPNLSKIKQKELTFQKYPVCNQKMKITGAGKVHIGERCSFGYKLGGGFYKGLIEIQSRYENSQINIGCNVLTNNNLFLCSANLIEIGDDVIIGQGVTIMDHEAHGTAPDKRRGIGVIGKVIIGRNVWLGNNVTILKNSEIGNNTIVAAGAVVSGRFPANVIIGGVPAKIIKNL